MEKVTILIVEDDPIIGADLQDRLLEMGYDTVGPYPSGEEAITIFSATSPPDLVIMDIQLEGQWDGIETARQLLEKHSSLPIIFLTSNSDDATFGKAKTTKPAAFLSKPFRGRDLKHAIELAIAQSALRKETTSEATAEENAFLLKDRLFIKVKDRMVRLFFSDILWVEADDYYCKVVTKEKEYLVTQTLKKSGRNWLACQN
ncbi:MAG: response regulator [Saprospiraceae bacterium]|nr:response regulator [Saprospiraceae bacterium]